MQVAHLIPRDLDYEFTMSTESGVGSNASPTINLVIRHSYNKDAGDVKVSILLTSSIRDVKLLLKGNPLLGNPSVRSQRLICSGIEHPDDKILSAVFEHKNVLEPQHCLLITRGRKISTASLPPAQKAQSPEIIPTAQSASIAQPNTETPRSTLNATSVSHFSANEGLMDVTGINLPVVGTSMTSGVGYSSPISSPHMYQPMQQGTPVVNESIRKSIEDSFANCSPKVREIVGPDVQRLLLLQRQNQETQNFQSNHLKMLRMQHQMTQQYQLMHRMHHQPLSTTKHVSGAGSVEVNGTYYLTNGDHYGDFVYIKQHIDGSRMELFRHQGWFNIQGVDSSGRYQPVHYGVPAQTNDPPEFGWGSVCYNSSWSGKAPMPSVTSPKSEVNPRIENFINSNTYMNLNGLHFPEEVNAQPMIHSDVPTAGLPYVPHIRPGVGGGYGVVPPPPAPMAPPAAAAPADVPVVRQIFVLRVRLFDLKLLLKLALFVSILAQDGGPERLACLVLFAFVVYLYQIGLLSEFRTMIRARYFQDEGNRNNENVPANAPILEEAALRLTSQNHSMTTGAIFSRRTAGYDEYFYDVVYLITGFFFSLLPWWSPYRYNPPGLERFQSVPRTHSSMEEVNSVAEVPITEIVDGNVNDDEPLREGLRQRR